MRFPGLRWLNSLHRTTPKARTAAHQEFDPLIISIDTKGKNLIEENKAVFNQKKKKKKKKPILERINAPVRFIK